MTDKYSLQTSAFDVTFANISKENDLYQARLTVVPATDLQGMRKAKNFTISLVLTNFLKGDIMYWALVYVPQGTPVNRLLDGVASPPTAGDGYTKFSLAFLYQPSQYLIASGVKIISGASVRLFSPLARNLNSGDQILLLFGTKYSAIAQMVGTVRYAITLQ